MILQLFSEAMHNDWLVNTYKTYTPHILCKKSNSDLEIAHLVFSIRYTYHSLEDLITLLEVRVILSSLYFGMN